MTSALAELLRDHSGVRTRERDDHRFRTELGLTPVSCRLQVFTAAGRRPVVVAIQARGEPGQSLINVSEYFAAHVWRTMLPDEPEPPIWIELIVGIGSGDPLFVRHVVDGEFLLRSPPTWSPMTPRQLNSLVGMEVELDRGDGFEPPPAPAQYVTRYTPFPVAALPRGARPYRVGFCMPVREQRWRYYLWRLVPFRQRLQRRLGCCWYHQGDWKLVNSVALRLLADAEAADVHADDVQAHVLAAAKAERLDPWTFLALRSLFLPPIVLAHADDGSVSFVNGIHRTQAMRDAKVRTTIVAEDELVDATDT